MGQVAAEAGRTAQLANHSLELVTGSNAKFANTAAQRLQTALAELDQAAQGSRLLANDTHFPSDVARYNSALTGVQQLQPEVVKAMGAAAPTEKLLAAKMAQYNEIIATVPAGTVKGYNTLDASAREAFYQHFPGGKAFFDEQDSLLTQARSWSLDPVLAKRFGEKIDALANVAGEIHAKASPAAVDALQRAKEQTAFASTIHSLTGA
ncbi:MAG: hypothetical protein JWN41_398 [Thermoleophilia bacterium]|nr:hypothetical protein [Thermoleophilia bacterium]